MGGDGAIQIQMNMGLVCTGGNIEISFNIGDCTALCHIRF